MSLRLWDNIADEKLRRKAGLLVCLIACLRCFFPLFSCMKQRIFWAQGAEGFPLPAPLTSFLDRERKRFLAFARNDEGEESVFLYRKPSSCGAREAAFSLLPMEGGAPKGRRLESPRYEREYEESVLSYRHPERSRGIFYGVAVFCTYEVMIKSCGCFGCSSSDALRLIVVQGRFLATLEMTIWGRRPCEGSAFLHDCCVAP